MSLPRLILCNGIDVPETDPLRLGRHPVRLSTHGRNSNVNLRVENVADVFQNRLSPRLEDLLEIATFVFFADTATERSGQWKEGDSEEPWERKFQFVTWRFGRRPTYRNCFATPSTSSPTTSSSSISGLSAHCLNDRDILRTAATPIGRSTMPTASSCFPADSIHYPAQCGPLQPVRS